MNYRRNRAKSPLMFDVVVSETLIMQKMMVFCQSQNIQIFFIYKLFFTILPFSNQITILRLLSWFKFTENRQWKQILKHFVVQKSLTHYQISSNIISMNIINHISPLQKDSFSKKLSCFYYNIFLCVSIIQYNISNNKSWDFFSSII